MEPNYIDPMHGAITLLQPDDALVNSSEGSANCTPETFLKELLKLAMEEDLTHHMSVVTVVYSVICAIGLLANIGLLLALIIGVAGGATFKVSSTIFITNLAIADTLILLTLPFSILQRQHGLWLYGSLSCKLEETIKYVGYYSAMFFITAMAVDRYFAVCHAVSYERRRKYKHLWLVSLCLWCLGLIFAIPIMIFADINSFAHCNINFPNENFDIAEVFPSAGEYTLPSYEEGNFLTNQTMDCLESINQHSFSSSLYSDYSLPIEDETDSSNYIPIIPLTAEKEIEIIVCRHEASRGLHIWLTSNFVVAFVVPFLVTSICYILIMKFRSDIARQQPVHLNLENMSNTRQNGAVQTSSQQQFRSGSILHVNNRTTGLMDILIPTLILTFLVCWFPFHLWHLLKMNGLPSISEKTCSIVRDVTICLAFSKSALNPILNSFFLFNFKGLLSMPLMKKITHPRASIHQTEIEACNTVTQDVENRACESRLSSGNVLHIYEEP